MPKRPPKPDHDDELEDEEPPGPCYTPEDVVEQERAKRAADVVDRWWYRNRDGEGVLLRFRLEANDCNVTLHAVMHGHDQWATGWPADKKVPLYRAYEGRGKLPIFVVQGEAAVDSAIAMGLSAVTSAGGADDVDKSDWQPTAGRPVVILPENSDQGRRFARAVAGRILGLEPAPQVRMLALPGLDEGEDIGSFGWDAKLSPVQLAARVRELALRSPVMKPADLGGGPVMDEMADAPPAAVRWLWPGRVPIGKPLVIFGGLDSGKSIVALDLAARVSAGAQWPDGCGRAARGKVILMSREDNLRDTIRPRLDLAGADPRQIVRLDQVTRFIGGKEVRRDITLLDLADLQRAVEIAANVRLLVIESLSAFFGNHMPSSPRIRAAIRGLTELADRHGFAVVITAEVGGRDGLGYGPNKTLVSVVPSAWLLWPDPVPLEASGSSEIEALVPSGGEALVPGEVRALVPGEVEALVPSGGEALVPGEVRALVPSEVEALVPSGGGGSVPQRRRFLLLPLKSVGGDPGVGLACRIGADSMIWEPEPVVGADRMLPHALGLPALSLTGVSLPAASLPAVSLSNPSNPPNGRRGPRPVCREAAAQWLQQQLGDGPVLVGAPSPAVAEPGTLRAAAKSAGLAWTNVHRASHDMQVVREQCPQSGRHLWRLPDPAPDGGNTSGP